MKFKSRTAVSFNNSVVFGVLLGAVAALIISMILTTGMTSLVLGGRLNDRLLQIFIFVIRLISVFIGVLLGTGLIGEKWIVITGVISVLYLLLLAGVGIVFYDGSFQGFGVSLISVVLGGAAGCLVRLKLQNKPQRKKKIRV